MAGDFTVLQQSSGARDRFPMLTASNNL